MFEFLHNVKYIPNPSITHANTVSGTSKKIFVLRPITHCMRWIYKIHKHDQKYHTHTCMENTPRVFGS